jgi:hypothetical protein
MDIVIPLGRNEKRSHWELRYLLRSLELNFLGMGKVWVIGEKPSWITNIEHIPYGDPYPANKDGNIIGKIFHVCKQPALSEYFLRCSDDQLLLKPLIPLEHANYFDLTAIPKPPPSKWYKRLQATQQYCKKNKWITYNFDTHVPSFVNKEYFLEFMKDKSLNDKLGVTINTLYFNQYYSRTVGKIPFKCLKPGVRADFTITVHDTDNITSMLNNNLFACYSDYGMVQHFVTTIQNMFPNKSKYEL